MLSSAEFEHQKTKLRISSSVQKVDGVHVRFVGYDGIPREATAVEPELEDAYLLLTEGVNAL